ncbi:MAG: CopD family protein [Chloroflexi bacterium]|nr:CopD family protein [Chloroflexota bacterium]
MAAACLFIVVATGVFSASLWVRPASLVASSYGLSLLVKVALVAALIGVGALHHAALNPQRFRTLGGLGRPAWRVAAHAADRSGVRRAGAGRRRLVDRDAGAGAARCADRRRAADRRTNGRRPHRVAFHQPRRVGDQHLRRDRNARRRARHRRSRDDTSRQP